MTDKAWDLINSMRETWCDAPCNHRKGCGCADAIKTALDEAWWAGFENAADIAKGHAIEETLRSKIEHFKE